MKKMNVLKCFLCCALLGGIGLISSSVTKDPIVGAYAATVFDSEGKNMNGTNAYKASEGNFLSFENWHNLRYGISFEFKFNTETQNQFVFKLRSGDTDLTGNLYGFRANMTAGDVGKWCVVDSTNGWYRYELIFTDVAKASAASGSETANNFFILGHWGPNYVQNWTIRNMKKIRNYSCDMSAKDVTSKTSDISRWDEAFPFIANWGSSTKGIFVEYKPGNDTSRIPFALEVRGSTAGNVKLNSNVTNTSPDSKWYMNVHDGSNLVAPTIGREFDLGNGWRRYELMMPELAASPYIVTGTTNGELYKLDWLWGASGINYRWKAVAQFGTIDQYSSSVTYNVNGTVTKELAPQGVVYEPLAPKVEGQRFVGWGVGSATGSNFDFSTKITSDTALFAKFEKFGTTLFQESSTVKSLWMSYDVNGLSYSNIVASLRFGVRFDYSTFIKICDEADADGLDVDFGVAISKDGGTSYPAAPYICDVIAFLDANGEETYDEEEKAYVQFSLVLDDMPKNVYNKAIFAKAFVKVGTAYYYAQETSGSIKTVAQEYVSEHATDPKVAPHLGALQALIDSIDD